MIDKNEIQENGLESYGRYYSCYKGIVVSNEDPEFNARLQVRVPQIHGEDVPETWAWSKGMFAGNGAGFYALPKPGDPVWVSFEGGDADYPVWEYGWFADDFIPEQAKVSGGTSYVFQTTAKQRLHMDDESGFIRLEAKDGIVLELNKDGISLGSKKKSAEPVVMGDKNFDQHTNVKNQLTATLDALIKYCNTQQAATSSTPVLAPLKAGYVTMKTTLTAIKKIITDTWPDAITATKSKKNTTD